MRSFPKDPREAAEFLRYHRRSRKRNPRLQVLAMLMFTPLVALLSRVRFVGRKNIPDGAFIAAANHPSQLDAIFVAIALRRRVHFMGKSDLFRGRAGRLFSRLGGFPVRRGVWDADAFQTAETVLGRGKVMCMFPEGGVSIPGGYRDAKPGIGHIAHRAGATVLPVHLDGVRRLYRPWTWPKITVTIGEPFAVARCDEPTREQTLATAQLILDRVTALDRKAVS
jgi:1-acyl-sn-glycerol-3-phosphate acyltransferase